jgi:hypothetical protein
MAITGNVIGAISGSLLALTQQLIEKAKAHAEFESGDPDIVDGVVKIFNDATLLIEELRLAEESIAMNQTFSAIGQQEAMAKVVKDLHGRTKRIEKAAIQRREAHVSEQAAALATPKPLDDPHISFLKEQEQRQRLRLLSLPDRMRAYADAVQRNEVTLVRAIKDPAFISEMLVDKAFVDFTERVDREHVKFKTPQTWTRLQTLEKAAQWLTLLWSAFDLQLDNYGAIPSFKTPPTSTMDLGLKDTTAPPKKSATMDKPPTTTPAFV